MFAKFYFRLNYLVAITSQDGLYLYYAISPKSFTLLKLGEY